MRLVIDKKELELLLEQIKEFKPKYVAVYNEESAQKLKNMIPSDINIEVLSGMEGLKTISSLPEIDVLLTAIVGMIGLVPTLEAIKHKKDIALANKETLVCAGKLVMSEAKKNGVKILPVDSEHSAIFQSLNGENYKEIEKDPKIRVLRWEREFNYSAINNFGVQHANGDYLLFLNNDVTVITPDWIEEMLGMCQREEVGAVGVKLLYPDDTIQHAGCVIGIGGIAGHMFVDMPANRTGYLHKASIIQDMSAVTAACMMMKRTAFEEAGGFTEKLAVAFNDVDLCLKVRKSGRLIVYDPYVQLYHMESKTRGAEDSEAKVRRFQEEIEYMREHWIDILKNGDPYYNKNLSLTKWNYSLRPLKGMDSKGKDRR